MADDASERARREFVGRAPELRKALVAELAALLDGNPALSPDESAVLHHVLAFAGYSLDGGLYIPAFAALWGEEASYFPAVHLPAARVRAASALLRRRGILSAVGVAPHATAHTEGVFLMAEVLRGLAAPPPPAPVRPVRKKKRRRN